MNTKNSGETQEIEQLKKQIINKMAQTIEECQTEASRIGTEFALKKWKETRSEELREEQLTKHIARLFLNNDLRRFLIQFSRSFSNTKQQVEVLKLCRKILAQNPERKIPYQDPYFKAFESEFLAEIENDIELDPIKWVDEELKYISDVNQLETGKQTVSTEQIPETPWLTREQAVEYYKTSASTLDRWRKEGLQSQKIGGKVLINKDVANRWVAENLGIKKRVSFN